MATREKLVDAADVSDDSAVQIVLVVDDSRSQRRILSVYLARWGFQVIEAASGAQGLEICKRQKIDLVLSDWMMPDMDGLEFCAAFRQLKTEHYGYFILLLSKSEKQEVARGLDVGADDFLTKPVAAMELLARIRAGERILKMQRELTEKNRLVVETLDEISALYESLELDLVEARRMQQSLIRENFRDFGAAKVSLLLKPCGHVGGDLVGFFEINDNEIGLFAIDVSGHGVASALMTARLAGYLSGASPDHNLALMRTADGQVIPRSPAHAVHRINQLIIEEIETELYFTMLLGHFDLRSGSGRIVQCGHPNVALQRRNGLVEFCGEGGLPVGLFADATWQDFRFHLSPGDRLLMASDGISECPTGDGELLGDDGLASLMRRNCDLNGKVFLDALVWDLTKFAGDQPFPDDISAVLLEFDGP